MVRRQCGNIGLRQCRVVAVDGALTLGGGTLSNVSGSVITVANATTLTGNSTLAGTSGLALNGTFTNSGASRTLTVSNRASTTFGTVDLSELTDGPYVNYHRRR